MNLLPRSSWRLGLRSQEYFRQPPRARLSLELLEGRLVPSTFFVVPALSANGLNSFATLQQALGPAKAGDTIQIEPGSQPGDATVTLNNLTIKADPQFGNTALQNSGTEIGDLKLGGSHNKFIDLFVHELEITATQTGETIIDCIFEGFGLTQDFGPGVNGHDTVTGCTFLACTVGLGNTPGSATDTAANDVITNNIFRDATEPLSAAITVSNETAGLVVSNNFIKTVAVAVGSGISAEDCVGTISANGVGFSTHLDFGIAVIDNGSGDAQTTNLTVSNNVLKSGIECFHGSTANSFTVSVSNNTLASAAPPVEVGLFLDGNRAGGSNDFGSITAAGNDFRNYDGVTTFAISATDSAVNTSVILAQANIFSVANPSTVVKANNGSTIDVSNPLTGGAANLTAMFQTLDGGPPTAGQHSMFDNSTALQQGQATVLSSQATTVLVQGLYESLLQRVGLAGEVQGWAAALQNGTLTEEQVIAGFVTSPEYFNKVTQGSANPNGAWVQSLYVNLLGRQGSGTEIINWVNAIPSIGLAGVAKGFVGSFEFRSGQVQAFYGVPPLGVIPTADLLKRNSIPAAAEISGWVNSGLSLLDMEAHILSSSEFAMNG
jgi:hypothetical protein